MRCPKCKAGGAKRRKVLVNLGRKQYYPNFITRYYMCSKCGHRFLTQEKYYRDVERASEALDDEAK